MLSVVIATLNDEEGLARSLASLVSAAADGLIRDVVITDGGSADSTLVVADAAGCQIADLAGTRAERKARAALEFARCDWFLFLKPGVLLETGFSDDIATFIDRRSRRGDAHSLAGIFTRAPDPDAGLIRRLREGISRLSGPSPEQGLVISRTFYRSLGGHRPSKADEDKAILNRIGRRRLVTLRSRAVRIEL